MPDAPFVALVPVGGAGTRLWPISNERTPKQFLKLFHQQSLFQSTVDRLRAAHVDDLLVITGAAYERLAAEELKAIRQTGRILVEPARRDSGPAIAAGAAWALLEHGENCTIAVLPADHLIPDAEAFATALRRAVDVAAQGWIVTLSVTPTEPTSEFGYIERGDELPQSGAHQVRKFHEKPSGERAQAYIKAGNFGWNAGVFVFTAGFFAKEAERHMPEVWKAAREAVKLAKHRENTMILHTQAFSSAPKLSIDYALLEKSERVATLPVDFEWRDVGNWNSVYEALAKSLGDNVVVGEAVVDDDVRGSLIYSEGLKIAVAGMSDVVVVASGDGVFVAPRTKAADIKRLLPK